MLFLLLSPSIFGIIGAVVACVCQVRETEFEGTRFLSCQAVPFGWREAVAANDGASTMRTHTHVDRLTDSSVTGGCHPFFVLSFHPFSPNATTYTPRGNEKGHASPSRG